ncbi:MAG: DNA polymerase III subunit gamma/tau [Ruthenibacterium sp.]
MYRALYRKWRPATFEDVVGQEHITTALKNQLLHDKVGHAYLFTGTRGTGKTTCAKIFAKAVNCQHRNGADPCCKCSVCTGIDDGSVMDVVEIDAASNNGVDNIRDLRDETAYTPSVGTYKVYIIDEVHMLSTAAFNALLKIMEEPPSHVIFILATTEIHKVPATILSRCQRYDFTRISPEKITGRLLYIAKEEKIPLTDGAAGLIARLADGAMRDALSILDTCAGVTDEVNEDVVRRMAGVTDKTYLFDLGQEIANKDAPNALALVATLREKSIDIKRLCDELVLHYRNLLLAGVTDGQNLLTGVSVEEEQRYLEAAKTISQQEALRGIQMFCEALDKMGKGTDARIELELAIFKLCTPAVQVQTMVPPQAAPQTFASAPMPVYEQQPKLIHSQTAPVSETPPQAPVPPSPPLNPPPALAAGVKEELFADWQAVVQAMEAKDKCLFVNMRNSRAYYDGRRVLIDGSELFTEYMRQHKSSFDSIKQTIAEVTGKNYAIGPYKKPVQKAETQQTTEDSLAKLAQQGVQIVYEN